MSESSNIPPRRSIMRHKELLAAIASGFVATLALATSTYNVYLQRQQVRAQVLPRLGMGTDFANAGVTLSVINRGVGPAEVKRVRVTVDGKRAEDWIDAVTSLLHVNGLDYVPEIQQLEGNVMSPGLEVQALKIPSFKDSVAFLEQRRRLAVEICYCSTLDDCWVLDSPAGGSTSTRAVSDCAEDPKPFHSVSDQTMDELLATLSRDGGTPADASARRDGN